MMEKMLDPKVSISQGCRKVCHLLGLNDQKKRFIPTEEFTVGSTTCVFDSRTGHGIEELRGINEYESDSGEREQLEALLSYVKSDDVVFDIGAHLGFYTTFIAKHLTEGVVHAFEPYPANVDQLETNLELNDLTAEIYPIALSDTSGTMHARAPDQEATGYQMLSLTSNNSQQQTINTISGDELIAKEDISVPNVIKIDVEGAEPLVINGLKETLAKAECRVLSLEVHLPSDAPISSVRDHGTSFNEIKNEIKEAGFEIVEKSDRDSERHIIAQK